MNSERVDSPSFTIFTAAFNRPNLLKRAWQSLEAQTLRDLEWVIVDDGSGPDVRRAVEEIQRDASFPVRYFWQTNQGKHVAHNRAVQEARGTYFATLDDDDTLLPQALERSLFHWDQISAAERDNYVSVMGLCVDEGGKLHGNPFPLDRGDADFSKRNWRDGDHMEMELRWRSHHERWGTLRTEVLRAYPFPMPVGQVSYMIEDVILFRMARYYRTRYVNEVWRVWYRGHQTLTNYITERLPDFQKIAPVQITVRRHRFVEFYDQIRYDRHFVLRSATQYTRFSLHHGDSLIAQWRDIPWLWPRLIWLVMLPTGVALWIRDRWRMWRSHRESISSAVAYRPDDPIQGDR